MVVAMPPKTGTGNRKSALRWADSLPQTLAHLGIHDRTELAARTGIPKTTVYAAFDDDWTGRPTTHVIAAMARALNLPLAELVDEPAGPDARRPRRKAAAR
jgi:hypothetical protein